MSPCSGQSGMFWKLVPSSQSGYFHLKTLFRGDNECLEGNQFLAENTAGGAAFMSPCSGQSGMFWKLVPSSQSGYFHLKTLFRGDNECLEGNQFLAENTAGGAAFMSPCSGQSGMFWRLKTILSVRFDRTVLLCYPMDATTIPLT